MANFKELNGKRLLGIDKKTKRVRATAVRVEATTPGMGPVRGWIVEQDGALVAVKRSWDACVAYMREQKLTVRIVDTSDEQIKQPEADPEPAT